MAADVETGVGKSYPRLAIRNATVVSGRGTPAEGPIDLVIKDGVIETVRRVDPISQSFSGEGSQVDPSDHVIDASGMCVLPGLIDAHTHVPTDPAHCGPGGWQYAYKLWLGHGVTTIRTVDFGNEAELAGHRRCMQQDGTVAVPRLVIMAGGWPPHVHIKPEEARAHVRRFRELGADGLKLIPGMLVTINLATLEAMCDEARKAGMEAGVAIHLALNSELNAAMASDAGVRTIEHTYGIPEAAIPGVQNFPLGYNEMDEIARFRHSANNWPDADRYPERVLDVLDRMIRNGTVWSPTMVVYEANRDITRAQTTPWYDKYATPVLLNRWKPQPGIHASYHFDWRTSDEIAWKEKYRLWMKYLRVFFERGGTIIAGADAGWLHTLYGFSMIRELELLQEAGFHPLDVVRMATTNSARVLALQDLQAGIFPGAPADLAIVDGNPLENFKVMYGTGVDRFLDDRKTKVRTGGVRWTIRGGVVFDARALLKDVEEYVQQMKLEAAAVSSVPSS
ncbi:MAG: amidohydrolase family protein [Bacillota bacterium]|nr:amidohydrolase family protein [Bacillota bacterium]